MIWDCVEVEDIYNFSTVSKRVYHLVREALREHCKLSKRLSTISNVGPERGVSGLLGPILKEILLNPRAARYPSLLEIGLNKYDRDDEGEHTRRMVPESDLELFKQAVWANIDSADDEMEEDWLTSINAGNEEPLVALLLLLLPNVRKLRLDFGLDTCFCIKQALLTIMNHEHSASLRKLQTMDFLWSANIDGDLLYLGLARHIGALPSLTRIRGHGIGIRPVLDDECSMILDDWNFNPEDLFYTPDPIMYPINVTSLCFLRCCVNPKSLFDFLGSSNKLQHFYHIPMEPASLTSKFYPFWIRTALVAHADKSLKTLTILAGEREKSFMGSLVNFTSLEFVQTDLQLLMGDPSMTLLVAFQLLPSSIVHLRLHIDSPSDDACCKDIIKNIIDMPDYFARLIEFNVIGVADVQAAEQFHESLIKVLAERGITVSFEMKKSWQDFENDFDNDEIL